MRASDRLTDSVACLIAPDFGPDRQLEKMLAAHGRLSERAKPILEINPTHPLTLVARRQRFQRRQGQAADRGLGLSHARRGAPARGRPGRGPAGLRGAPAARAGEGAGIARATGSMGARSFPPLRGKVALRSSAGRATVMLRGSPVLGRAQGWRFAPPPPAASALTPSAHRAFWHSCGRRDAPPGGRAAARSCRGSIRVPGLVAREHGVEDDDQLAHAGDDGDLGLPCPWRAGVGSRP